MTKTFTFEQPRNGSWLRFYAFAMAGFTFFLMALGSATRVMNAGLSCPDWPLCYGEVVPIVQMNLQVFLEWFHRIVATSIGMLTIGFAGATIWYRQSLPRWAPGSGAIALTIVIFQGILGGLTVTELLRFDIVTAHLATGMLFWATWITIGILLSGKPKTGWSFRGTDRLAWSAGGAAVCVYGQSILGALAASQWAVHQCLTNAVLCTVVSNHIYGVVPVSISITVLLWLIWRNPEAPQWYRSAARGISGLLIIQIILGITTYRLQLQLEILTVMHQSIGAALFGLLLGLALRAKQEEQQAEESICKN